MPARPDSDARLPAPSAGLSWLSADRRLPRYRFYRGGYNDRRSDRHTVQRLHWPPRWLSADQSPTAAAPAVPGCSAVSPGSPAGQPPHFPVPHDSHDRPASPAADPL